jgi:CheY-like chemotaxis protein
VAKTVILIDDDQDDLDIMKETIQGIDSSLLCISFVYPDEALRVVSSELVFIPNFIFIDINMPIIPGDKLLREFRKNPALKNTSIVMFSTSMPAPVAQVLMERGANKTFQKPSKVADYKTILSSILS